MISTEADAWWLPDTSGTDYRRQHTKSTIVLNDLDADAHRLGYFHNAGYYSLDGEDYAKTFEPPVMPLFAELVRIDRVVKRPAGELVARSRELLARHVGRRPKDNPVARFAQRFAADLPDIQQRGLAYYHVWAFATVRQLGAAAELAALYLRWLDGGGTLADGGAHAAAIEAYDRISTGAKSFILKAARAVNAKKQLDAAPIFDDWARAWDQAMGTLEK